MTSGRSSSALCSSEPVRSGPPAHNGSHAGGSLAGNDCSLASSTASSSHSACARLGSIPTTRASFDSLLHRANQGGRTGAPAARPRKQMAKFRRRESKRTENGSDVTLCQDIHDGSWYIGRVGDRALDPIPLGAFCSPLRLAHGPIRNSAAARGTRRVRRCISGDNLIDYSSGSTMICRAPFRGCSSWARPTSPIMARTGSAPARSCRASRTATSSCPTPSATTWSERRSRPSRPITTRAAKPSRAWTSVSRSSSAFAAGAPSTASIASSAISCGSTVEWRATSVG